MLAAERHHQILKMLEEHRYVSSETISSRFGVSLETVRRDLADLQAQGRLLRVRGGAQHRSPTSREEAGHEERASHATTAKAAMARAAASLVAPGMTLMLDVGTSCVAVARALPQNFRGRVVTCSLLVAAELADRPAVEVLVAGGRVRPGDLAVSNSTTVEYFNDLRPDIAFLGSGGLDESAGLTDYYVDEVATRRTVLATASASYVLADATKLGNVAPFRVCGLDGFTGVITDRLEPVGLASALARIGAHVVIGEE